MLNLEQLNHSFGLHQHEQKKTEVHFNTVLARHDRQIDELFKRIKELESAREVQIGINTKLLKEHKDKPSFWDWFKIFK